MNLAISRFFNQARRRWTVLTLTAVVIFFILLYLARQLFFFYDDWILLWEYTSGSPHLFLLTPNYEHLRPVFKLLYFTELRLFGLNYLPILGVNIILHLLVGLVVFQLIWHSTREFILALVGFILFSIHPAAYEVVFWGSTQDTILMTLFGLLAYVAFFWQRNLPQTVLFSILSMFSWAVGFIFPLSLFLVSLLKRKKGLQMTSALALVISLYIFIYLVFGRSGLTVNNQTLFTIQSLGGVGPYVLKGVHDGLIGDLFFNPPRFLGYALMLIVSIFCLWTFRRLPHPRRPLYMLLVLLVPMQYAVIAPFRFILPGSQQIASRYQYFPKAIFFVIFFIGWSYFRRSLSVTFKKLSDLCSFWFIAGLVFVSLFIHQELSQTRSILVGKDKAIIRRVLLDPDYNGDVPLSIEPMLDSSELRQVYSYFQVYEK